MCQRRTTTKLAHPAKSIVLENIRSLILAPLGSSADSAILLKENVTLKVRRLQDCKYLKHIQVIRNVNSLLLEEYGVNNCMARKGAPHTQLGIRASMLPNHMRKFWNCVCLPHRTHHGKRRPRSCCHCQSVWTCLSDVAGRPVPALVYACNFTRRWKIFCCCPGNLKFPAGTTDGFPLYALKSLKNSVNFVSVYERTTCALPVQTLPVSLDCSNSTLWTVLRVLVLYLTDSNIFAL